MSTTYNKNMKNIIISILILISIFSIGYYFYTRSYDELKVDNSETVIPDNRIETPPIEEDKEIVPKPESITYDEKPAKTDAKYFEKTIEIQGQYAYIAYPITILKDTPPRLIIYSHGSNTTVSNDKSNLFMNDLKMYGEYFTKRGFAFAASNMQGPNLDSTQSVVDMYNLKTWIQKRYLIKDKVDLIGFSRGGYSTFNYMFKYPKGVNSTALLAPTSKDYTQAQLTSIKRIPIQIWHGTSDVNVPLSLSTSLESRYNGFELKNLELTILNGKSHFDIDTELRKEILNFFNEYE